jgi:hypothetical protein
MGRGHTGDMKNTWKDRQDAIRILQRCAYQAASQRPVNSDAVTTLHNAVFYLLTGRLHEHRGSTSPCLRAITEEVNKGASK